MLEDEDRKVLFYSMSSASLSREQVDAPHQESADLLLPQ